ncbi:unnamed protein product [Auanema sp. JU1783]|nr:unnamed protein product [Auanema sp. JU1783]
MFFRNASADAAVNPAPSSCRSSRRLMRAGDRRRSSVIEWINGLSDNNQKPPDVWDRVEARTRATDKFSVTSVDEPDPDESTAHKIELINKLKREVKVIMEEAVTKRSLDINSPYVTSLCGAIEACLMDGLRRRLLGLFGTQTSLALLHTASKKCPQAERVLKKVNELNPQIPGTNQHLAWIREALHMRILHDIVVYLSSHKSVSRLYDPSALMMDRSKGGMVAALLLGPCAVTYKRMSTAEPCEPSAEEMCDRRGISSVSSIASSSSTSTSRPPLQMQRQCSSIVGSSVDHRSSSVSSRDYVYSLHHNFKSSLLYGKNNVCLASKENEVPVKGYLSLHKSHDGQLSLKWTPNQLMHASSQPSSASIRDKDEQWLWKHAISIDINDIIYIHLHQKDENSECTLSFVDCEGVQSPPLQLPAGQHALTFLTSLESGLAPLLRLEPPLWTGNGSEKMLPKLRKRSTAVSATMAIMDLVFRIVRTSGKDPIPSPELQSPTSAEHECQSLPNSPYIKSNVENLVNLQLDRACQSVRHEILKRAFTGWLTYCRHLRTIREHLLYLVNTRQIDNEVELQPVDDAFWKRCRAERTPELEQEFLLRVYWKGIEGSNPKELRRQAWPFLLKLFNWQDSPEPKTSEFTQRYREDVEKWRVLEAEVRRKDEEAFIAARHRKNSPIPKEDSIMSDVFEEEKQEVVEPEKPKEEDILLAQFGTNLHRIDKDVERCDRNLIFFSNKENLESLRRVMCTYVRRNLEEGYIQGMCDILAPLLVIFEDEALSLECFTIIMERLRDNFPQRNGMDQCLSNLRALLQVVDGAIYTRLTSSDDFTHLYFSYRWFLLDFKRELSYDSTYRVWETIWAASRTFTQHFALFFGLAMVTNYRDVIINNDMDFTDMIKFFNDMAERHDCMRLLQAARGHVKSLQILVQQIR